MQMAGTVSMLNHQHTSRISKYGGKLLGETNVWNWKRKKEPQNLNPKIEAVSFLMCDRTVNLYYHYYYYFLSYS